MSAIAFDTMMPALQAWVVACSGLAGTNVIFADGQDRPSGTYIAIMPPTVLPIATDWTKHRDKPLVLAPRTVNAVSAVANTLTLTAHVYLTADGPVQLTTTGMLPGGLALTTNYWIVKIDANTIKLATTYQNARHGTVIDLLDAGTGVHTIVGTAATRRGGQEIEEVVTGVRKLTMQIQCFAAPPTGITAAYGVLTDLVARARLTSKMTMLRAVGLGLIRFTAIETTPEIKNRVVFEPRAITTVEFHAMSELGEGATYIENAEVTNLMTGKTTTVPVT